MSLYEEHEAAVMHVCKEVGARWGVSVMELCHEVWLDFQREDILLYVAKLPENEVRPYVKVCARRAAWRYGKAEAKARDPLSVDQHEYTTTAVRALLPFILDHAVDGTTKPRPPRVANSKALASDGQEGNVAMSDLTVGFGRMAMTDRQWLYDRFCLEFGSDAELALYWNVSLPAARSRVSRAVSRLADAMNGYVQPRYDAHWGPQLREPATQRPLGHFY